MERTRRTKDRLVVLLVALGVLVLVPVVAVVVLLGPWGASDDWDPPDGLPAQWATDDGRADETGWVSVQLEADGTADLWNVPLWDGQGECEPASVRVYSGQASWTYDRGFTISVPDLGSVDLLPTARLGRTVWEKVALASCGPQSPQDRLVFLVGGGPDGDLGDPRDRMS